MGVTDGLAPEIFWKLFTLIASIPHPSGEEAALAQKLRAVAEEAGLVCRADDAGNLRIDRPAAPGGEKLPHVILHGHLDMVSVADHPFDFHTTPITLRRDGEWISACGTTLGADDGIGVAQALGLLMTPGSYSGPLSALLTACEEDGLLGASKLSAEFLEGDYLFNLDGSRNRFCIGAAGGCRQEFTFAISRSNGVPAGHGVRIAVSGMKGGHSGMCIHEKRGNAILFLARFLAEHPSLSIADFSGGVAHNAIPATAEALCMTETAVETLQRDAEALTAKLRTEFDAPAEFAVTAEAAPVQERCYTPEFRTRLLKVLCECPDGMLEFNDALNVTQTSSNIAIVCRRDDRLIVSVFQRGMIDRLREACTEKISRLFEEAGATVKTLSSYPGWEPVTDSPLLRTASQTFRACFGEEPTVVAVHGGVEAGWFSRKNPELAIINIGTLMENVHTFHERMHIPSAARSWKFLNALLKNFEK